MSYHIDRETLGTSAKDVVDGVEEQVKRFGLCQEGQMEEENPSVQLSNLSGACMYVCVRISV